MSARTLSRLTSIYLVIALTASVAVLVVAWKTGATPAAEAQQFGRIQLRILRQARQRIEEYLLMQLEYKVRQLAQLPVIVDPQQRAGDALSAIDKVISNLELEDVQFQRLAADGVTVLLETPMFTRPRMFPSPDEVQSLLDWARDPNHQGTTRIETTELPTLREVSTRSAVRYTVPVWSSKEKGKAEFQGMLCLWVSSAAVLRNYLSNTHLLPESYSFGVSWTLEDNSTDAMPKLLWYSSEPQWFRPQSRDAQAFLVAMRKQIQAFQDRSVDYDIVEVPRLDGHSRREVLALDAVVFGKQRWIVGLSTPYEIASERSAAQRWFMITLGFLALGIFLVGVALLFFANEQRRRQLREVQHDYRELFAENPTAMLVFNDDGKLVDCNHSAERLVGTSRHEALGQRWSEMFIEVGPETFLTHLQRRGHLYTREKSLTRASDQSTLLVEMWGRRIGDYWIIMAHDVEQRRDLERQIARFKRMDSMGSLASALAHDFNNLLGQIQILVSHLRTEAPADSDMHSDLAAIEEKVDDASQLVANLLAFRESVISEEPVWLEPILRDFFANQRKVLPENIQLSTEIRPDLPSVWITPHALRRVLDNLCLNARDAMPYGGKLTLRAYGRLIETQHGNDELVPDHYAVIEIADTGVGMSPEVLDTIFEPFFSTKEEGKGVGLGLWTVYKIVRRVGGWIHVRSRVGKGTQFTIFLRHSPPKDRYVSTRDEDSGLRRQIQRQQP